MQDPFRSGEAKPTGDTPAPGSRTAAEFKPSFGPDLQAQIGDQLRAMHHDVLIEKVPDRFVQLLEQLAKKETKGS